MAIIDGLIRQMFEREGERLAMAPGRPVTVLCGGEEEAITTYSPNPGQLERVVAEILPADSEEADAEGRHHFHYASPRGTVEIRARLAGDESLVLAFPISNNGADLHGRTEGSNEDGAESAASPRPGEEAHANGTGSSFTEATESAAVQPPADAPPGEPGDRAARPEATVTPPEPEPATAPPRPQMSGGPSAGSDATAPSDAAPAVPVAVVDDGGDPGAPAIDRLFRKMVAHGCSDLHVSAGAPPLFRRDGEIVDLGDEPTLRAEDTTRLLFEITPEKNRAEFEERRDTDFAYAIEGVARFRCNLFEDRRGVGGVFRQIPAEILTAEKLGLSPAVLKLCELRKGLVLVTGPTGSGKSTTLAAMVDYINRSRREHIITIEDPIEFVHDNHQCLVNQREVGIHTAGFKPALRAALREDPDIVLVGEMRDLETVQIALETAETGHLVFGTLHTNTAPTTVSRIIDQFPSGQQAQIRTMLAESLKGVIAQTLCRRKAGGRVAAMEILIVTNAVANLIREEKTFQIPSVMQTGRGAGMRTMNDALLELVRDGTVEAEEAYRNAVDKSEFLGVLERNGIRLQVRETPT